MKCKNPKNQLLAYIDRELPDDELKKVEKHMELCKDCKLEFDQFAELKQILKVNNPVLDFSHGSFEKLWEEVIQVPPTDIQPVITREPGRTEIFPCILQGIQRICGMFKLSTAFVIIMCVGISYFILNKISRLDGNNINIPIIGAGLDTTETVDSERRLSGVEINYSRIKDGNSLIITPDIVLLNPQERSKFNDLNFISLKLTFTTEIVSSDELFSIPENVREPLEAFYAIVRSFREEGASKYKEISIAVNKQNFEIIKQSIIDEETIQLIENAENEHVDE